MCVFFAIAAAISIPTDSTCVCVTRHADYITAEIVIGTPMKHVSLLVRMDGGTVLLTMLPFVAAEIVSVKTRHCESSVDATSVRSRVE